MDQSSITYLAKEKNHLLGSWTAVEVSCRTWQGTSLFLPHPHELMWDKRPKLHFPSSCQERNACPPWKTALPHGANGMPEWVEASWTGPSGPSVWFPSSPWESPLGKRWAGPHFQSSLFFSVSNTKINEPNFGYLSKKRPVPPLSKYKYVSTFKAPSRRKWGGHIWETIGWQVVITLYFEEEIKCTMMSRMLLELRPNF